MELNSGEVICPNCNGDGFIKPDGCPLFFHMHVLMESWCWRCKGLGKIDWIMNITGDEVPVDNGADISKIYLREITKAVSLLLKKKKENDVNYSCDDTLDIYIKPTRAIEHIVVNVKWR